MRKKMQGLPLFFFKKIMHPTDYQHQKSTGLIMVETLGD
jgi:hypothetical protein